MCMSTKILVMEWDGECVFRVLYDFGLNETKGKVTFPDDIYVKVKKLITISKQCFRNEAMKRN